MVRCSSKRECATLDRFTERYSERHGDAGAAIEREVIGANVGLNGYTTVAQADRLARVLRLRPGMRLLDVGAGNGWPGVYLTKRTGCQVVLSDVPMPALMNALARLRRERVARRGDALLATAAAMPFAPASFDAIVHTDVMCCVSGKLAVMKACRRMLKPGAGMAFFTIHTPREIDAAGRRLAYRYGPRMVNSRIDYPMLLARAGFREVRGFDVTREYLRISIRWVRAREHHMPALQSSLGEARVREMLSDGRLNIKGIRLGVLRRALFVARA